MRRPILALCLLLALGSAASSQSGTPPDDALSPMEIIAALPPPAPGSGTAPGKADAAKKTSAGNTAEAKVDPMVQCLRDWDAGTHMSRQDWARTCRRVVTNRAKLLRERDGD
jgi:hypothetical protein